MKALVCSYLLLLSNLVAAEELRIAVAANFQPTLAKISSEFERETGHRVSLSSGSTGLHYAQIVNGAPFDLFFAADEERPRLLEAAGKTKPGSRFDYAIGRLALCSPGVDIPDDIKVWLNDAAIDRLAIANPRLAPYGAAAVEVLQKTGSRERLQDKLVMGENISQALQFTVSGNVTAGFIAHEQARARPATSEWSCQQVPGDWHSPIRQQAVVLKNSAAGRAFVEFVQSPAAATIIKNAGYDLPH